MNPNLNSNETESQDKSKQVNTQSSPENEITASDPSLKKCTLTSDKFEEPIISIYLNIDNSLLLKTDKRDIIYTRTRIKDTTWYFSCRNKRKGDETGKKCYGTATLDSETMKVTFRKPHNEHCFDDEESDIPVKADFINQKENLLLHLNENPHLTPTESLKILRNDCDKKIPLSYQQVSDLIAKYRKDNNINTEAKIDEGDFTLTKDKAIFLRCHSIHHKIYKGIFAAFSILYLFFRCTYFISICNLDVTMAS